MKGAVKLASSRDDGVKQSRRILIEAARSRPHACMVIYRDNDGLIHSKGSFRNRLEMIGAIEALKQEVWDS